LKVHIRQGDISTFNGNAIVNAANVVLLGGGGVDGVIQRAAGPDLKAWIRANIPIIEHDIRCRTGDAVLSPGFYLKAKHIIHTVGPMFHDSPTARNVAYAGEIQEKATLAGIQPRDLLAKSIRSCLEMAEANGIKTLAMPAISCGVFGCTVPVFAKVLSEVVAEKTWGLDALYVVLYQDWEMAEFEQTWEFLTKK
jgi:O-acetyl-ADP-ribose deacetylase (regulator of RNase III)